MPWIEDTSLFGDEDWDAMVRNGPRPERVATWACPGCKRRWRVLKDEYGDHPCPHCGWEEDHGSAETDS